MKIYAIDYSQDDTPSGWVFEWFPNKAEAEKRARYLRDNAAAEKVSGVDGPNVMDVPTHSKKEMIAFLNTYATNGMSS